MTRAFLFLRNLHSSVITPGSYDRVYYDYAIEEPLHGITTPFSVSSSARKKCLYAAKMALESYLHQAIHPLSLQEAEETLARDGVSELTVACPLGERIELPCRIGMTEVIVIENPLPIKAGHKTFKGYYDLARWHPWEQKPSQTDLERAIRDRLANYLSHQLPGYSDRRARLTEGVQSGISPWVALGVLPTESVFAIVRRYVAAHPGSDGEEFQRQTHWIGYCRYRYQTPSWQGHQKWWGYPPLTQSQRAILLCWIDGSLPEGDSPWVKGSSGGTVVERYINARMRDLKVGRPIPNRFRLITSYYLSRVLKIPWTYGQLYFRQVLVDYHPAVNRYNWYAQCVRNRFLSFYNIGTQISQRVSRPEWTCQEFNPDLFRAKEAS